MDSDSQTAAMAFLRRPLAIPMLCKRIAKRTARSAAFRILVFTLILLLHAFRRVRVPAISRSEHRLNPYKFTSVSLMRFVRGVGSDLLIHRQTYLCQQSRIAEPAPHAAQVVTSPWLCAWLYFANVLKLQGFFDDSEFLYRRLADESAVRDIALRGLGDLLALQAVWANEFDAYYVDGIALNAFRDLKKYANVSTWHDRKFPEAVAALTNAVQANTDNPDGWWLLAYVNTHAGRWQEALSADRECSARGVITFEERFSNATKTFAVDPAKGVSLYKTALESWSGWWRVADVPLATAFDLRDDKGTSYSAVGEACSHSIDAHIVRDSQIIPVHSKLRFDKTYVAEYVYAEVIPRYGMILANREYLIADSAHMKSCHVPLFTEAVRAISKDRALIACRAAMEYAQPGCIYIGHNKNYYHWLLDDVPRLSLLHHSGQYDDSPILIDVNAATWQISLLHRLGIDHSRLRSVDFTEPLGMNNLIVPSRLSKDMVAHPDAVRFMRNRLVPDADELTPRAGKRVYLSRNAQSGRAMLNEAAVIKKFRKAGFSVVDTSRMSLDEQIDLFADVEVIAGPGGAAITNALFAPRDAKVISLSSTDVTCHTFTSISSAIGQDLWILNGISFARPNPHWIWSMFDFEIDERDIDLCLRHVL
jgi:tetratricopeptide (TPR) repeat protein